MVRNIVNTNLLSNKKIKFRNEVIKEKNEDISEKKQIIAENQQKISEQDREIREKQQILEQRKMEVAKLQDEVQEKTQSLRETQAKIQNLNSNLSEKIKELKETAQKANTSQAVLNRQIAMMKLDNAKKISQLQNATQDMKEELAQAQAEHETKMAQMKSDFNNKMNAEREQLENQLGAEKATAAEKAKALAEFKEKMAGEKAQLDNQLAQLKDEVGKAKGEAEAAKNSLADAKKEHGRYLAAIDKLQKDKDGLSGDLKRAEEILGQKKKLAKKIADQLAKNGIKAGVDGKNGDVTIQFGEYFDTGRADLKPNMKDILRKFVPTYSKALLEDEKVAKEISSVEIVGFSSPTYKGKYVDPQSLSDQDKTAVAYNLDLSYNRAKSIFNYMFDKKEMSYSYQKDLLPLVKVTGRSFLAEEVKGRDIASGISHKEYCKTYDCEKSQKVIIRFNLKD
jgi:outer membrane protein OmpA-like peptidoglycan-associated protein